MAGISGATCLALRAIDSSGLAQARSKNCKASCLPHCYKRHALAAHILTACLHLHSLSCRPPPAQLASYARLDMGDSPSRPPLDSLATRGANTHALMHTCTHAHKQTHKQTNSCDAALGPCKNMAEMDQSRWGKGCEAAENSE